MRGSPGTRARLSGEHCLARLAGGLSGQAWLLRQSSKVLHTPASPPKDELAE
jgi:hypothetical protein